MSDERNGPVPFYGPCSDCAWYLGPIDGVGLACAAFPGGIPDAIFAGDHDHRTPFEGDGGLVFAERGSVSPKPSPKGSDEVAGAGR